MFDDKKNEFSNINLFTKMCPILNMVQISEYF